MKEYKDLEDLRSDVGHFLGYTDSFELPCYSVRIGFNGDAGKKLRTKKLKKVFINLCLNETLRATDREHYSSMVVMSVTSKDVGHKGWLTAAKECGATTIVKTKSVQKGKYSVWLVIFGGEVVCAE